MSAMDEVIRVLERYVSPLNARGMVTKAMRERNLEPATFTAGDIRKLSGSLQRGIRLFLGAQDITEALREIDDLCRKTASKVSSCSIEIISETDISTARVEARRLCEDFGAKSFTTQKVTTIVSELARNIVSYTAGGKVEIVPMNGHQRRIVVRATDSGPGIPHLNVVLSGHYQSKTGLGKGLWGTKRLADHFDVSTGPGGTRIVAEVIV
jgi:serine/threonine-protein kinase RsbT